MHDFKMDRFAVSKSSFEKADDHVTFYKNKTPLERLNYACDIINSIFNSSPDQKVDKQLYYQENKPNLFNLDFLNKYKPEFD